MDNPLSYLLEVYLPKHSETKKQFLKDCKRQYYFIDHTRFKGLCEISEV